MPNRNYVKRPRARRFQSIQSIKKNVGEMFLHNSDVPGLNKYNYTLTKTINIHVLPR